MTEAAGTAGVETAGTEAVKGAAAVEAGKAAAGTEAGKGAAAGSEAGKNAAGSEAGKGAAENLLGNAGSELSPVEKALSAVETAYEAMKKTPTPETEAAYSKALTDAKTAAKPQAPAAIVLDKTKFKAPEGMKLDEKSIEAFLPVANELGLTQDKAQKLITLQASMLDAQAKADAKAWDELQAAQVAESKKALGAKWEEELAFAAKTRDSFGSKELTAELNKWGLSNNIHVLNFFIKIGKQMSAAAHVEGGTGPEAKDDKAKNMFPSMGK